MKPHGPWKIKSTDNPYVDPFVTVRLDQVVRPDGNDGQHVVVYLKPGVCVLAIDENNDVHLTKEFHYGIGRDSLEAVSGGIDVVETEDSSLGCQPSNGNSEIVYKEDPLLTAQRELQEELGLVADTWEYLATVDPFTTVVVSPTRLYLARGLSKATANPEGTEVIEHVVMPLEMAMQKVIDGEITHAPTCIAILRASR